jgi:hypothetical protein
VEARCSWESGLVDGWRRSGGGALSPRLHRSSLMTEPPPTCAPVRAREGGRAVRIEWRIDGTIESPPAPRLI